MNALSTYLASGMPGSMNYLEYLSRIESLLKEGKTTGDNHSPLYLNFTELNLTRMKRVGKTYTPSSSLIASTEQLEPQTWIVITEAWCGDAAQSVPMMHRLASLNPSIDFRLILRDEHPEIMDLFLTDGGKGIPVLIAINAAHEVVFHWGPRPQEAQQMVRDYKAKPEPKPDYLSFAEDLQRWYAKDRGSSFDKELLAVFSTLLSVNRV